MILKDNSSISNPPILVSTSSNSEGNNTSGYGFRIIGNFSAYLYIDKRDADNLFLSLNGKNYKINKTQV